MSTYSDHELKAFYEDCLTARKKSYSPYSKYPVGCVLLDDKGQKHLGCNIETAHYKSNCAEATAIGHMIMAGGSKIKDIFVIGSSGEELCSPCGDCRQRIREFANDGIGIYCFSESGTLLRRYSMEELLPGSFGPENLSEKRS